MGLDWLDRRFLDDPQVLSLANKKVFLSGAVSGHDRAERLAIFERASRFCSSLGALYVFDPMRAVSPDAAHADAMRLCLSELLRPDDGGDGVELLYDVVVVLADTELDTFTGTMPLLDDAVRSLKTKASRKHGDDDVAVATGGYDNTIRYDNEMSHDGDEQIGLVAKHVAGTLSHSAGSALEQVVARAVGIPVIHESWLVGTDDMEDASAGKANNEVVANVHGNDMLDKWRW